MPMWECTHPCRACSPFTRTHPYAGVSMHYWGMVLQCVWEHAMHAQACTLLLVLPCTCCPPCCAESCLGGNEHKVASLLQDKWVSSGVCPGAEVLRSFKPNQGGQCICIPLHAWWQGPDEASMPPLYPPCQNGTPVAASPRACTLAHAPHHKHSGLKAQTAVPLSLCKERYKEGLLWAGRGTIPVNELTWPQSSPKPEPGGWLGSWRWSGDQGKPGFVTLLDTGRWEAAPANTGCCILAQVRVCIVCVFLHVHVCGCACVHVHMHIQVICLITHTLWRVHTPQNACVCVFPWGYKGLVHQGSSGCCRWGWLPWTGASFRGLYPLRTAFHGLSSLCAVFHGLHSLWTAFHGLHPSCTVFHGLRLLCTVVGQQGCARICRLAWMAFMAWLPVWDASCHLCCMLLLPSFLHAQDQVAAGNFAQSFPSLHPSLLIPCCFVMWDHTSYLLCLHEHMLPCPPWFSPAARTTLPQGRTQPLV